MEKSNFLSVLSLIVAIVGLALAGAAAWMAVDDSRMSVPAVWLAAAIIAWLLLRYGKANLFGVVLWLVAAVMISLGFWQPLFGEGFLLPTISASAVLFFLIAAVIFFAVSLMDGPHRAGNCAAFMVAMFSVIVPGVCGGTIAHVRSHPENIQETRLLLLKLHRLGADIEAIRARLGRLPKSEEELVGLRGQPMPTYYQNYHIHYYLCSQFSISEGNGYQLHSGTHHFWGEHWDLFPWIFQYHGPESVKRLDAEIF